MITQVIVKRPFLGSEISQESKSNLFSATDLVKIINKKRRELELTPFNLSQYLRGKQTKEFIEALQEENETVIKKDRGRNSMTWVHPLLFIDIALAVNPKLKIQVYQWLYDELLKYRNDSGDSYKKMCGALFNNTENKQYFPKYITKVATFIKSKVSVDNWNTANEQQLRLRDSIHNNISLLSDVLKNNDQAVRIGVEKAVSDYKDTVKFANTLNL